MGFRNLYLIFVVFELYPDRLTLLLIPLLPLLWIRLCVAFALLACDED